MKIKIKAALFAVSAALMCCSCTAIDEESVSGDGLPSAQLVTIHRDESTGTSEGYTEETLPSFNDTEYSEQTYSVTGENTAPADSRAKTLGRYIYGELSDREKKFYNELVKAAEAHEDKVYFSEDIDEDTARKVFSAVYNQEVQLFWLDGLFFHPVGNSQILKYRFTAEEVPAVKAETERAAGEIIARTEGMSDYDKVVYIHDYLVRNISFIGDGEENLTVYGALCRGKAQCEGYAFTFKYLCTLAGIDCITVTGSNGAETLHAWNMVDLDDIWYNVDTTWDDPLLNNTDNSDFLRRYYLLVPDSDILNISHFRNDEYFTYPPCYDGSRTYFAREGLLAGSSNEGIEMLENVSAAALAEGHRDAEVRFVSNSDYLMASKTLFDMGDIKRLAAAAKEKAGLDSSVGIQGMVKYLNDDLRIIHISF